MPFSRPDERGPPPVSDHTALAASYRRSPLSHEPDTFVLYRIIGNDLPPRHALGQSLENLRFILENEPPLASCEKRFVVNRIVDRGQEQAVRNLLEREGVGYVHIPFVGEDYGQISWDIAGVPAEYAPWTSRFAPLEPMYQGRALMRLYSHKNNYVMNNNGARNAALEDGRRLAKWILPWDGNCFLTVAAWEQIVSAVCDAPELKYHIVPMARITENSVLLESDFRPDPKEEPQILFRRDAALEFNSDYYYGRRPKVELFWRLGVPGKWDTWPLEPWDPPCPPYSSDAGAFAYAGWVARLFSGRAHLEEDLQGQRQDSRENRAFHDRGLARVEAIKRLLDTLDDELGPLDAGRLTQLAPTDSSNAQSRADVISQRLRVTADEALARGPFSVVDKKTLPPSGNRHDYWHPAPYYWPNPLRIPGLPYVRRDGRRLPGTQLYEPLSDNYDRTRLQRLFDDTFVLALAWREFGEDPYAVHASTLIRTWFLEPDTAMNPHLDYAQVRRGHNHNKGTCHGIIEMKDLYYFLDALRLMQDGGWLTSAEQARLQDWFGQYLRWLRTSSQGCEERTAVNNHGTYYDLQVAAIAAFLGESRLVRATLRDSCSRILSQFDESGRQISEMRRTMTAHYCCFNLQGWIHLAQLAERCGEDLWSFRSREGKGIRQAMHWLLPHIGNEWPYPQIDEFDRERFFPIYHACVARYGSPPDVDRDAVPGPEEIKPLFFPHDGVMPYWQFSTYVRAHRPDVGAC